MSVSRVAILVCFAALLGVPFVFRPAGERMPEDAAQVIIITPHNEQIRHEFAVGFDRWHRRKYGRRAQVIWNVPGGTSEIRKMLEAQYRAALESGDPPGGSSDVVMGGGSYEFSQYRKPLGIEVNGEKRSTTIIVPVDFDQAWLDALYGPNVIGNGLLYDKDRYWFGTALSGFGIVYNRDALADRGVPAPRDWGDLCDPRLINDLALVNPNQSGSIKSAFEAILQRKGWEQGWRILHRAGANARYFSGSSLKPPIDVTYGNAAMGMCIDFFGRYQARAMRDAGDEGRVGYIDPAGGSTIDADPVAMLRGAPHEETARRFIEFCLSPDGQALWQYPRRDPNDDAAMGPEKYELRRLPIVRSMYAEHGDRFIDKVNPFETATAIEKPNDNYRDLIGPMFAAMAMDNHALLKEAWRAIITHPAFPPGTDGMVGPSDATDATLRKMIELFDALPAVPAPGGKAINLAEVDRLGEIRAGWIRGGWKDQGLWDPETGAAEELRQRFGDFFRGNYREIIRLGEQSGSTF